MPGVKILITDPQKIPDKNHFAIVWARPPGVPEDDAGPYSRGEGAGLFYQVFEDHGEWQDAVTNAYRDRAAFKAIMVQVANVKMTLEMASASATRTRGV